MEKYLIHSNELHFINKERIHREVEKMVESLDMAAGSTKGPVYRSRKLFH